MQRSKIFKLLKSDHPIEQVLIKGWVRTRRDSKGFSFIEVNDGSSLKNIQVVADEKLPNYDEVKKLTTGSSNRKAAVRNGKFRRTAWKSSAWQRKTFLCRKSVTPMNS
jgi:aspartyl/asparaginyl-tRNA synthetase